MKIKNVLVILLITLPVLFVRYAGMTINNRTPQLGINESFYIEINGDKQWINIYGNQKMKLILQMKF